MKAVVAIMVYSESPSGTELASFEQCCKILSKQHLCLVCPQSLNTSIYRNIAERHCCELDIERFADGWFVSVQTYNKLMLEISFYARFATYDFLLVYQLDAWVFSDQLDFWCSKQFDYIGAPWFNDDGTMLERAGNGGFSLRRVQSFLTLLSDRTPSLNWFANPRSYITKRHLMPWNTIRELTFVRRHGNSLLLFFGGRLSPQIHFHYYKKNEDFAFVDAMWQLGHYHLPTPLEAAKFSFEQFPGTLYELNGRELPFGAHALERYDPGFWAEHIPVFTAGCSN